MPDRSRADSVRSVMEFVTSDDEGFSLDEFMSRWPQDPDLQRVLMAMLMARNSREIIRLRRHERRLWIALIVALVSAAVGVAHTFGADPFVAAIIGMLVGAITQMFSQGGP